MHNVCDTTSCHVSGMSLASSPAYVPRCSAINDDTTTASLCKQKKGRGCASTAQPIKINPCPCMLLSTAWTRKDTYDQQSSYPRATGCDVHNPQGQPLPAQLQLPFRPFAETCKPRVLMALTNWANPQEPAYPCIHCAQHGTFQLSMGSVPQNPHAETVAAYYDERVLLTYPS
jgi:hypothetical protein